MTIRRTFFALSIAGMLAAPVSPAHALWNRNKSDKSDKQQQKKGKTTAVHVDSHLVKGEHLVVKEERGKGVKPVELVHITEKINMFEFKDQTAESSPHWMKELTSYRLRADDGGPGRWFRRDLLLKEVSDGKRRIVGFDSSHGAKTYVDPKSEFVEVMTPDSSPDHPHFLSVASGEHFQPVHLFDVPREKAATVGKMFSSMLDAHNLPENAVHKTWVTSISMPGKLTIPYLHVHGEKDTHATWRPEWDTTKVADWHAWAKNNHFEMVSENEHFTVYKAKAGSRNNYKMIAVANAKYGTPGALKAGADKVIGDMVLDATSHFLNRNNRGPGGHIELDRFDQQLVVRLATFDEKNE